MKTNNIKKQIMIYINFNIHGNGEGCTEGSMVGLKANKNFQYLKIIKILRKKKQTWMHGWFKSWCKSRIIR